MKVTVLPIVIGALGTVTKRLVQWMEDLEIRGRMETIQTTALLRSARILRRVRENCCYSNSSEWPSADADVKNSHAVNNENNNDNNELIYEGAKLNELIYAGAKLVWEKIGIPSKPRRNTQNKDGKFDWKRK